MKLNHLQTREIRSLNSATSGSGKKPATGETPQAKGADRVQLSSMAAELSNAANDSASVSRGASSERLAELRDSINSGSYHIDITELATAILEDDLGEAYAASVG